MVMFVMLANVGLNGAGVFYNALLPHMGTDDEMDRISNLAFAYGYSWWWALTSSSPNYGIIFNR
jgi:MFS-type transporter involved in bile tolerance (Atg22 family)